MNTNLATVQSLINDIALTVAYCGGCVVETIHNAQRAAAVSP